ncbi:MAG: DUF3488 and transglutaminase-like domain-containing protein, partial [Actinomycetota bacterium]|nr:DUF3488 and transglutaminase-like domain-containing protein [Actinomycetota bacterium]
MTAQTRLTVASTAATLLVALCLTPLFQTGAWFVPAAALVLATVAACEAARRARVPGALVPFVGLAALVMAATYAFAREHALLWVVPTEDVIRHANALGLQARSDIEEYAAPVETFPGIVFVTALGTGAMALLVDTFAVTMRRAALAGLPLLGLFAVPAAVAPGGVGWVAFAVGAAAYLALLLADSRDRVGRWGRALATSSGRIDGRAVGRVETGPLAVAGRRVGVMAVGVAVLLPVLVPGLDDGFLTGSGNGFGVNGRGNGVVRVDNPIVELKDDLNRDDENVPVLTYRTNQRTSDYVRMVTLDRFDGTTWQPSKLEVSDRQRVDDGLPSPVGLAEGVASEVVTTSFEAQQLESLWLPVPYAAQQVDIDGRWLYDIETWNLFSANPLEGGDTYTVESLRIKPTAAQLRSAGAASAAFDRWLELPEDLPGVIADTARRVTQGRDTAYDKALALQDWLRDTSRFRYDEQAPGGNGSSIIATFLTEERRGFCVHYASAMALMARAEGIPARVSVGYLPGVSTGQGSYVVRAHDAHAWPELYFSGVGWVAFEPTPAARTGAPPAWA